MFGFRNIQKLSDNELIEKYRKNGDKSLIGVLFERYTDFVFFVSLKYLKDKEEAGEAVMQIFENLLSDLKEHKVEKFKPWLHVVTRNHCLLIIRSEKYKQKYHSEYEKDVKQFMENDSDLYHEDETNKEEKLVKLEEAIGKLNEEQQKCIKLFYIEEKSYTEVADITGYEMKKVKSYIQNGKRNLRIIMETES